MKKALLELFLFGLLFVCMISSILPSTFKTKVVELIVNVCSSVPEKPQTSLYVASAPEQTTNQPEESIKTYQKVTPTPKANKMRSVHKKKSKSYTKKSYGGQCAATTKRGTRCSRSASSGSIYCWQHQ